MQLQDDGSHSGSMVTRWVLDARDEDLDLEIHGCGCGCGCGCSCGCGCVCGCAGSDNDAEDDDDPASNDALADAVAGQQAAQAAAEAEDARDAEEGANMAANDELSIPSGCGTSAAWSSLGMDPVAGMTGEHHDPEKDESFIVTGARGSGGMSSPIGIQPVMEATGAALGNPGCQSAIVDSVVTTVDAARAVNQMLQQADEATQRSVDSLRD